MKQLGRSIDPSKRLFDFDSCLVTVHSIIHSVTMEWSPFHVLPRASLTQSGLLQLDTKDHEVELIRRGQIEMRPFDEDRPMAPRPKGSTSLWNSSSKNLKLTVTTHRLVFFDSHNQARFLHLSNVHQSESSGGASLTSWNASHKLTLSTYTYGDVVLRFRSSSGGQDRDNCEEQVKKAMERRQWEVASRLEQKKKADDSIAKRRVGVDHILTKKKLQQRQAARLADKALGGDSEQLLKEAVELLKVIKKSVRLLQKQQASSNSNETADAQQLESLLQDMGMTSALTRTQVGGSRDKNEYYELLARQVADFLLPKLPKMGGIISLTDVFCLFNRARGSNFVSPDDLVEACDLLSSLRLGLSKRTFPSGVVVIQVDDDKLDYKKLVDLCPATALEASHSLKISPLLAMEQLEEAERAGLLCRDVTLARTRFFPNRFVDDF